MPKDTKTWGNNKARACESLGFVHKKRLCQRFDTTSFVFSKLYFCEKYFFTMMKLPFINRIFPSYRSKIIAVMIGGVIVGGGALFMYMLRAHTYLGDDPAACVNCHIMSPYYATWFHSSHARDATCNDCHVPHENIVKKWTFKGMDGMKHVAAFLTKSEPQVIQAHEASSQVIMNNCIRCHTQLNTEFVKTGKIDYMMSMAGDGKACWDCHRDVPHGGKNSLSATPGAIVPLPESPVPEWLRKMIDHKE